MRVSLLFDSIGSAYSLTRREDPRIAKRIRLALGGRRGAPVPGRRFRCSHGRAAPIDDTYHSPPTTAALGELRQLI